VVLGNQICVQDGISIIFSETKGFRERIRGRKLGVPLGFFPISGKCGEGFMAVLAAPQPARRIAAEAGEPTRS